MSDETIISIAFKPLLEQACTGLGLPPPVYDCRDESTNEYSVTVVLQQEPHAYRINGGLGERKEASCEQVA